jgi:hypothetical protein
MAQVLSRLDALLPPLDALQPPLNCLLFSAKTGGRRKDFGHLVPRAHCHARKSGRCWHETHLAKRADFIAATVHVNPSTLYLCRTPEW